MAYDRSDWERLAGAVRRRRDELDKTQAEVASDGKFSTDRYSAIELGKVTSLMSKTIKALERGLDWAPGSVRAVLERGEPTPLPVNATVRPETVRAKAHIPEPDADLERQPGEGRREHFLRIADLWLADKEKGPVLEGLLEIWERDRDAG